MTSPRGHSRSRALGDVKVKGTVFPPITRAVNDLSKTYFVEHKLMVHGDSMGLPSSIPKGIDKGDSPSSSKSTLRRVTSTPEDAASSKLAQELQDLQIQERQYKNKIQSLQKIVEQLKLDIKTRDADLTATNQKLQEIEEHYKLLYKDECSNHHDTKQKVDKISRELEEKNQFVEKMKRKHEENIQDVKVTYEDKLQHSEDVRQREVSERDERIEKMKKQMADFLKNNSRERQQQLEELTKQLGKASEEANDLRVKLKSYVKPRNCERCDPLKQEVAKRDEKIVEQDTAIKELIAICQKFERQLTQQDVLLVQFQQRNEEKISSVKKKL